VEGRSAALIYTLSYLRKQLESSGMAWEPESLVVFCLSRVQISVQVSGSGEGGCCGLGLRSGFVKGVLQTGDAACGYDTNTWEFPNIDVFFSFERSVHAMFI
jgi:hypothetical protein